MKIKYTEALNKILLDKEKNTFFQLPKKAYNLKLLSDQSIFKTNSHEISNKEFIQSYFKSSPQESIKFSPFNKFGSRSKALSNDSQNIINSPEILSKKMKSKKLKRYKTGRKNFQFSNTFEDFYFKRSNDIFKKKKNEILKKCKTSIKSLMSSKKLTKNLTYSEYGHYKSSSSNKNEKNFIKIQSGTLSLLKYLKLNIFKFFERYKERMNEIDIWLIKDFLEIHIKHELPYKSLSHQNVLENK